MYIIFIFEANTAEHLSQIQLYSALSAGYYKSFKAWNSLTQPDPGSLTAQGRGQQGPVPP